MSLMSAFTLGVSRDLGIGVGFPTLPWLGPPTWPRHSQPFEVYSLRGKGVKGPCRQLGIRGYGGTVGASVQSRPRRAAGSPAPAAPTPPAPPTASAASRPTPPATTGPAPSARPGVRTGYAVSYVRRTPA